MNNSSVYDIQIISIEALRRAQVHGRAVREDNLEYIIDCLRLAMLPRIKHN